jgi:glutamyl-tRNA synthetase
MHLGNARTALLSWLQVRARGGQWLLRIEDLDRARSRREVVDTLFRDLEYLGLEWDGSPVFQSERDEAYRSALTALERKGRLYPCFCTRAQVARSASAPHGPADDGPRYPGTCAALTAAQRESAARQRAPALRFRAQGGDTAFVDEVAGPVSQDVAQSVGDFVVRKGDGEAAYQLAVVVDDAESGVTQVLRADDLLASTPRQLQLYEALGRPAPAFAHVPLLLGEDGKRLAKRDGVFAVADLAAAKVPAEKVIGLLAHWSGLTDGGPARAAELVAGFSLAALPRQPVVARHADIEARLR